MSDSLPPGAILFSQLDITPEFDDSQRLTADEWIVTIPLNMLIEHPESRGLPAIGSSADKVYEIAARLSRLREAASASGDGVYCPVCHIANVDLARVHAPCPQCGRALLRFGWD